jgi:hypothetical protein
MKLMSAAIRNSVLHVLLASYLFVGVAAHSEAFGFIFGLDTDPVRVTESKPADPAGAKVSWIEHKHIPAITKVSLVPPVAVISQDFPLLQRYGILPVFSSHPRCCPLERSPRDPRAPPVV